MTDNPWPPDLREALESAISLRSSMWWKQNPDLQNALGKVWNKMRSSHPGTAIEAAREALRAELHKDGQYFGLYYGKNFVDSVHGAGMAKEIADAINAFGGASLSSLPQAHDGAEGQSGPAYDPKAPPTPAGAEGRQSPGLEEFEEAVRAEVDAGYMHSVTSPEYLAAKSRLDAARASLAAPGAPQGGGGPQKRVCYKCHAETYTAEQYCVAAPFGNICGGNLSPYPSFASPSQEEGPAGVDLAEYMRGMKSRERYLKREEARRAQAPASSPRDPGVSMDGRILAENGYGPDFHPPKGETPSEAAGDLEAKLDRLCESVKHWAQNGMTADLLEVVEWNRASILSARPPDDTPIEAAGTRKVAAALYAQARANGKLYWQYRRSGDANPWPLIAKERRRAYWNAAGIARVVGAAPGTAIEKAAREGQGAFARGVRHGISAVRPAGGLPELSVLRIIRAGWEEDCRLRASPSSLPQEGAAGEGEPLPAVGEPKTALNAPTWAPKRIYLQPADEDMEEEVQRPTNQFDMDGASWCEDRVNDFDVEYVRADLVPKAAKPPLSPKGEGSNTSNTNATQEGAQEPKEGGAA